MIRLPSSKDQELVQDAISHPEDYDVRLYLTIEDEEIAAFEGTWGQSQIPITLDATLGGAVGNAVPRRLDGGEVKLVCVVDGKQVQQLISAKSEFLRGTDSSTDLLASSPGSLLFGEDAIKLGEFTEYFGLEPEHIALNAARRIPYDQSRVRIDRARSPALTYAGSGAATGGTSPGFQAEEVAGAPLARLEQDVGYLFRDTADRGLVGEIPRPLAHGQAPPAKPRFEARTLDASQLTDWNPTRTSLRFYDVRVFRSNPDGSLAFESRERVPYPETSAPEPASRRPLRRSRRSPFVFPGQTLNVVLDDLSPAGPENARRRAVNLALELARGLYAGDLTLPYFDFLIELEDRFVLSERTEHEDGIYEGLWLLNTASYAHSVGGSVDSSTLQTKINYTALILEESRIAVPQMIVPGRSPGVLRTEA